MKTLVAQRIFGLVPDYEDLSDHDRLRDNPGLALVAGPSFSAWIVRIGSTGAALAEDPVVRIGGDPLIGGPRGCVDRCRLRFSS